MGSPPKEIWMCQHPDGRWYGPYDPPETAEDWDCGEWQNYVLPSSTQRAPNCTFQKVPGINNRYQCATHGGYMGYIPKFCPESGGRVITEDSQ